MRNIRVKAAIPSPWRALLKCLGVPCRPHP